MEKTKLLGPPVVSGSLARKDYNWLETTPKEFGEMLARKLEQIGAKTWRMDVYTSSDLVYRNMEVRWLSFGKVKSLRLHFNREEGNHLNIETD